MGDGFYLCGCNIEDKKTYSTHMATVIGGEPQYTSNRFDDEGFMVCPEHGLRRYGWHSTPEKNSKFMGMSSLEIERRKMFGKAVPTQNKLKIESNVPDKRDNRDPQEMTDAVKAALAEIRADRNGHSN